MTTKKRKNQLEHYSSMQGFFDDANYSRKAVVKGKLKGMSASHFDDWQHYLARKHFNTGSEGFTFSPIALAALWEHYNA